MQIDDLFDLSQLIGQKRFFGAHDHRNIVFGNDGNALLKALRLFTKVSMFDSASM